MLWANGCSGWRRLWPETGLPLPRRDPRDPGAERVQPFLDPLVAALDLVGVIDRGGAFGADRGQQHGHAGVDDGSVGNDLKWSVAAQLKTAVRRRGARRTLTAIAHIFCDVRDTQSAPGLIAAE